MADVQRVVVVGGGLAAAKTAESLRAKGFAGSITILAEERHLPYERPNLSKAYLQGEKGVDSLFVHPEDWYAENDVDLRRGVRAESLDRGSRTVRLGGGEEVPYDVLVLATGSSPRTLDVPGADLEGVLELRTLDDSDRLRSVLESASRIVVVGAGWIGLEAAAAARKAGVDVTVVETMPLPLARVLGPEMAQVFADLHRENGVDLRTGVGVDSFVGDDGRVVAVRLADGSDLAAEAVLVGVGITPNVALAQAAGLEVENGIVVDERLRTSDPAVYAVGDVANAWHPVLGRRLRVEHWANALNQPGVAAADIVGERAAYERQPYFYTDQYDLGMEYTGYAEPGGYDRVVVRGDLGAREFVAFWVKDGHVLAGMNVNVWDVVDDIKALIAADHPIDLDRLADPDVPLSDLA